MIQKPQGASDKPMQVIESKDIPIKEFQISTHLTKMEKRYADQDAIFCRPCGWISPAGLPNLKFSKKREADWEYVIGVVEANEGISSMSVLELDWCEWAGDPITTWKIPTKKIVALPRGLAKMIQDKCKYMAYVVKKRDVCEGDSHGDYLTSWKGEEIRETATFRKVNDL